MTVFEAVIDSLTAAAARGDVNAQAELDLLGEHRQKQGDLAASKLRYADSPVRALEAKYKPIADVGRVISSLIYARMVPCVHRALTKFFKGAQRRARKARGKVDYEVGYRKPPVSTRFTKERNPRGNARPGDVWATLERSRNKPVVVTSAQGKTVTTTRCAIAHTQLFRNAIGNKRGARAATRKIIIQLDQKGMLSPPDRPRRAKRNIKPVSIEMQMLLKVAVIGVAPSVKHDMVECFTRRYGPVPDFVTAYERQLAIVRDSKGWAEVEAWAAELISQRAAARDAAALREKVVEARPVISGRQRTRASLRPPTKSSSSAPASSVSLASPKQPRVKASVVKPQKPAASGSKPKPKPKPKR